MKLLALDTATEACSAALIIDGQTQAIFELAPREHTRLLLGMADRLLAEAQLTVASLDALAFGRGPGSFTGVRIATGVVQGMAFAADLPVVPVSTLASIAQLASDEQQQTNVLATLDARMGGIYWGCYQRNADGLVDLLGSEHVTAVDGITLATQETWSVAGSAIKAYDSALQQHLATHKGVFYPDYLPHSASIAKLAVASFQSGGAVSAEQALPVYLRDDVAKKASQQGRS